MTTPMNNPKVAEIRRSVQSSYDELNLLIADHLTALDPAKLYQQPAENEWTIMQSLAHVVEFMPYWANEIEKLVAAPGQNFGRALPSSYAHLEQVLGKLKDSDLELTGHHPRFGDKTLAWFIEDFVTHHLI